MASPTSPPLRLLLRAGLLVGAVLDSAIVMTLLATSLGVSAGPWPAWTQSADVSYSSLLWPALAGRACIQLLACYDRRRYDAAIPWLALTLLMSGLALMWQDAPNGSMMPKLVAAYGLIGAVQLISWRRTR